MGGDHLHGSAGAEPSYCGRRLIVDGRSVSDSCPTWGTKRVCDVHGKAAVSQKKEAAGRPGLLVEATTSGDNKVAGGCRLRGGGGNCPLVI